MPPHGARSKHSCQGMSDARLALLFRVTGALVIAQRSGSVQRMPRVASSTFEFQYSTYFWYLVEVRKGTCSGHRSRWPQRCACFLASL